MYISSLSIHLSIFMHAYVSTNSVDRQNQTHAAAHNICGLCVPRRRCPVVPLSLRLKRESELQAFSCVITMLTFSSSGAEMASQAAQLRIFRIAMYTVYVYPIR